MYERQPDCAETALGYSVRSGNLELVKWIYEQLQRPKAELSNPNPAHKQVMKHKHEKVHSIDVAAMYGFVELMQWLHEHRPDDCTTNAMDLAAAGGHFKAVKWLHVNRSEGCTASALKSAIEKGRLEIVQWLLENRKECSDSISAESMDLAEKCGHLDIVK